MDKELNIIAALSFLFGVGCLTSLALSVANAPWCDPGGVWTGDSELSLMYFAVCMGCLACLHACIDWVKFLQEKQAE